MELLAQDTVRNGNQYEDRTDGTDQLLFTHLLPLVIRRILQKKNMWGRVYAIWSKEDVSPSPRNIHQDLLIFLIQ